MEIIANQPAWKQALDILSPIRSASGSAVLPILNCVLIQALDTGLTLTRTDRERQLRAPLHANQVNGQGEVAVDARKLASIIAALPTAATVRTSLTATGRLSLTAAVGSRVVSRFTLGTLPGADFPLMDASGDEAGPGPARKATAGAPGGDTAGGGNGDGASGAGGDVADGAQGQAERLTLPGKRLAAALHATGFAMAKDDVRYYLNGLLLQWRGATLLAVATDGHRLADVGLALSAEAGDGEAILPRDTVDIIARLASEAGDADLTLDVYPHRRLACARGGIELISKLIDGRYPEWRRVVPGHAQPAAHWVLPTADLAAALGRVKILSHEQFHGVVLEVRELEPRLLYLYANNTQQDAAEEAVVLPEDSAPGRWGFNCDYLQDVLSHCPTAAIELRLGDGATSALLKPGMAGTDDGMDDPEWVVMPMLL